MSFNKYARSSYKRYAAAKPHLYPTVPTYNYSSVGVRLAGQDVRSASQTLGKEQRSAHTPLAMRRKGQLKKRSKFKFYSKKYLFKKLF